MSVDALRYLSAADVERCLPDTDEQLALATVALVALGRGTAEMPAKIGVHPRPGALLHAMPAWLHDGDLVGLKWISAFPGNRTHGLTAINGLMVLNDAETGLPTWIMDAARITAVRTAAVSGVAIGLFGPPAVESVAILGAGVQGASHVQMLRSVLPDAALLIHDRHPERARALADEARDAGQNAQAVADARTATDGAQIVITMGSLGGSQQIMGPEWLTQGTLVVAVDFATHASAELARAVDRFVVDDREQFLAYRSSGYFDRYPEPESTLGDELVAGERVDAGEEPGAATEPDAGDKVTRVSSAGLPALVTHLGVGLADVLFAAAIARRATDLGAGTELNR